MNTLVRPAQPWSQEAAVDPATSLTVVTLTVVTMAAVLAGWFPIAASVAVVFLFAGPQNWLEARSFMTQMPARWGRLRGFFSLGIGGVVGLTSAMIALPWIAWLWPMGWGIGLVYLHPLVALAFLDSEIGRRRPALRPACRRCLAAIPMALGALAWRLAAAPDLPGADVLTAQITRHAGGGIVPHVSTHFLVAAHTFLEILPYASWCLALPLLVVEGTPWWLTGTPQTRRSAAWRRLLSGVLVTGGIVVVTFRTGFFIDYPPDPERVLHHRTRARAGRGAISRPGGVIACHRTMPRCGRSCPLATW